MQIESTRALIADHFGVEVAAAADEADFAADLGADSLDMIELAMRLEEALDITIADDESAACSTVGQALSLVEAKVATRSQPLQVMAAFCPPQ